MRVKAKQEYVMNTAQGFLWGCSDGCLLYVATPERLLNIDIIVLLDILHMCRIQGHHTLQVRLIMNSTNSDRAELLPLFIIYVFNLRSD